MTESKGILFYPEWIELINHFTSDEKVQFYDALFQMKGSAVFENKNLQSVFRFVMKAVLKNNVKYKKTCETNSENAKARWANNNNASACEPMRTHASASKVKRFTKPTVAEVEDYCKEINKNINCEEFIDYYDSNGWKVGKNAMKDWKATIRRWTKNDKKSSSNFDDMIKELSNES